VRSVRDGVVRLAGENQIVQTRFILPTSLDAEKIDVVLLGAWYCEGRIAVMDPLDNLPGRVALRLVPAAETAPEVVNWGGRSARPQPVDPARF